MLENFLRHRKMQKLREGFTPAVLQERLREMEEYLGTDEAVLQLGTLDEIFARGMDHHNNKRYNEAVPFFDETRKMRGDEEDFRMLGKCWCISENEGREAKMKAAQTSIVAFMSIKDVLKAEDNYYLGLNFINIAERTEGKSRADNYRKAVSYLEKAVEKEGNNWIYHNSLGDAYECIADEEEDLAKKVDFYEKAVNQFNESTSLAGLGIDFDRIEKKLARAKEEYRKHEEEVEAALKEEERKKAGQEKAAEARLDDFFGRGEKTQTSTGVGDYTTVERIANSDLCTVYKAEDKDGEPCVVKVLRAKWRKYVSDRFIDAAKKLKKLKNKNTARYFDSGTDEKGAPYLVMEFFGGPYASLDSIERPLPLPEAVNITQQLASALAYAHKKEVYHGCINPSEVFYDRETGAVKLADFMLSNILLKAMSEAGGELLDKAGLGGTGTFQIPESIQPYHPTMVSGYDPKKADVNSLGWLFYNLLTGRTRKEYVHDLGVMSHLPYKAASLVESMASKDLKIIPSTSTLVKKLRSLAKQIK